MPSIEIVNAPLKMKTNDRFLLVLGTLEVKKLKPRNPKRPTKYVGKRKRTAVVLTVANGRGQRRA